MYLIFNNNKKLIYNNVFFGYITWDNNFKLLKNSNTNIVNLNINKFLIKKIILDQKDKITNIYLYNYDVHL